MITPVPILPEMVNTVSEIFSFIDECINSKDHDLTNEDILSSLTVAPFSVDEDEFVFLLPNHKYKPYITTLDRFKTYIQSTPSGSLNIIAVYPEKFVKGVQKCYDLGIGVTEEEIDIELKRREKEFTESKENEEEKDNK